MRIAGKTASEIFESIRLLVQSHQLAPGASLPTVRELAAELQVNRNTVSAAYQRLVNAGLAVTRGRNGTVIREQHAPGEQEGGLPDSVLHDVASGNPNPDWLPDPLQFLNAESYSTRLYGEAVINDSLEAYAIDWFEPDCIHDFEVNLTHGAVDAIERLLTTTLVTGDKVAIEDPCFLGSINTLRIKGFQTASVAVDEQGMRPEALEQALADGARALLCTPRAHNPTGCSVSPQRAETLRAILKRYPHVMIIEDDHFSLLASTPYQSIVTPETTHWAIVRSVSKCYGPDLRVAFVASDKITSQRLRMRLASGTTWVSHILQNIVTNLLTNPKAIAAVNHARDHYTQQRTALLNALSARGIGALTPCDGLNVWIPLQTNARDLINEMAKRGWLIRSGEAFYAGDAQQAIRITISSLTDHQAIQLVDDLVQCL